MAISKFSDKGMALREFLGAFIMDKSLNKKGILFYNANTGKNLDSVLMENYGRMYKAKQWKKIQIRLKGIAKEMISDQIIEFEYPSLDQGDDVTKYFTDHVVLGWAVKNNFIDDELLLLFKNIVLQNFKIYYQERGHYIGLVPKTKVLDLSIGLEELLDKEIDQGYYNKIIGDKQRRYGYTHILRRNAQMNLQTWQKTILYNWKQFNFVAGARRIGKSILENDKILLANGSYKEAKDITMNDKIMGSNYKGTNIEQLEKGKRKLCYKITLDNGMSKTVTYDHRIPTSKNYNGIWDINNGVEKYKTVEELYNEGTNEMLAVVLNTPDTLIEDYTEDDLLLYGYFLGNGTHGKNYISGNHPELDKYSNSITQKKGYKYYYIKGYKERINLEGLDELSINKFIDNKIFTQSNKLKWKVIDGLINTDGYLGICGGKKSNDGYNRKITSHIEYCSVSERLIDDLQSLLYQLGVICYKTKKKIKSNYTTDNEFAYYINISNSESIRLIINNCNLKHKKNYDNFIKGIYEYTNCNIGVIPKRAREYITNSSRINKLPSYNFQRRKIKENYIGIDSWLDYSWHKIKKIEPVGEQNIVSIQVSNNDELYWCNNILTHNTFMSAMIAYREIYKLGGGYGARDRQILYVTVTDDKSWQPFQYLKLLMKKDIELGYIKVSGKEFTNTITNAKLIFVTAGSKSGARSFGADLVIIDEAAEIPDDYWTDLLPIIMQEKATVYAISTINEDSQNGWFYRELVRGELTGRDDYNAIRVTIDDNELLDDKTREDAKAKIMEVSQIKYWTELYCIFPSSNSVFKMSGIIQPALEELSKSFVIGYDPGKINDDAGLVVVDMQNLRVIEEMPLKYMQYKDQKKILAELKDKYKATVVLDRTGVGEAVFEIVQDLIDVSVKYKKSGGEINYNKEHNYYNVPKKDLVETLQLYIESYGLKINSGIEQLITQMKGFKKFNSGSYVTYCGVGVKDDLVNALLLCGFYMKHIKGLNGRNQIVEQGGVGRILDNFNGQDWFDEYTSDDNFKKYIY